MIPAVALASLRWGKVVLAAAAAMLVLGIGALRSATVEAYPEFTPTAVQVQTEALGLSAAEVESLVTVPLEQDLLNGVPWVDHISSTSSPGLSAIDIVFKTGTDPLNARQMVQERMTQIRALPNVGTPPIMVQPLASLGRVAMIGLSSDDKSTAGLLDLSFRARWTIKSRLMAVPGVASVLVYGQRDRQLQVQVDPARMVQRHATLSDVISTTGNALWVSPLSYLEANTPGTGGFVESPNQRLAIQHILPISTSADLAKVPLTSDTARKARLSDVAKVVVDHQPLIGDAQPTGQPGVVLVVEKFPGASTSQVTTGVEAALAELGPGLSGIHVDTHIYRPASYLASSLHHLAVAGVVSAVLLLAALSLLLYSWRKAMVVFGAVSTSLVGAALVLQLRGQEFTLLTLAGFAAALVVVVDAAVADTTAMASMQGANDESSGAGPSGAGERIALALGQARRSGLYALLISAALALPTVFLTPFARSFSRPFVATFLLALVVAFVAAMILTPVLAGLLLRDSDAARVSPLLGWLRPGFSRLLRTVLHRSRYPLAAVAVLTIALVALAPQFSRGAVLPALREPDLLVRLRTLPGTALPEMNRVTDAMAGEIRALPGVADVGVHVGRAIASEQTTDVNTAEVWVNLNANDLAAARRAVTDVASGYPGVASAVSSYAEDQLATWQPAKGDEVTVRVFAKDDTSLRTASRSVLHAVSGIAGVSAAAAEPVQVQPAAEVAVNLPAAQKYGLGPGDVRRTVTTMMSGLLVGNLYEHQAVFDVVVRGPVSVNNSLTGLDSISIDTPTGRRVPLRDVASVTLRPEPSVIRHESIARSLDVTVHVNGRSPSAVAADISARVATLPMPAEAHVAVLPISGGVFGTGWTVPALAVGAVIAVLLLLQAATGNWRLSIGMLGLMPLAAVGGIAGAELTGSVRSVGALAGLLALFALVAAQGLRMVQAYGDAAKDRPEVDRRDLVESVTAAHVPPVLVTTAAIVAVLLPALIFGNQSGLEVLQPLAATILAGLLTAVPVVLLVVPWLYLRTSPSPTTVPGRPGLGHPIESAERS